MCSSTWVWDDLHKWLQCGYMVGWAGVIYPFVNKECTTWSPAGGIASGYSNHPLSSMHPVKLFHRFCSSIALEPAYEACPQASSILPTMLWLPEWMLQCGCYMYVGCVRVCWEPMLLCAPFSFMALKLCMQSCVVIPRIGLPLPRKVHSQNTVDFY